MKSEEGQVWQEPPNKPGGETLVWLKRSGEKPQLVRQQVTLFWQKYLTVNLNSSDTVVTFDRDDLFVQ